MGLPVSVLHMRLVQDASDHSRSRTTRGRVYLVSSMMEVRRESALLSTDLPLVYGFLISIFGMVKLADMHCVSKSQELPGVLCS